MDSCLTPQLGNNQYHMVTAQMVDSEVVFDSDCGFNTAMRDGFFRILVPEEDNLSAAKAFAQTFTSNPKYNQFGSLDTVNGYIDSEVAQTILFNLERDNWDKCHVNQTEVTEHEEPNYPKEIQKIGHKMHNVGQEVLRSILKQLHLPENLWFRATGGAAFGEGGHYLLFNQYDPKKSDCKMGLSAHKDFGYVAVLYTEEPGLEAKIDGTWRQIFLQPGYYTINFGLSLEKLLPSVKASEHRVPFQKEKMRTSIVAFVGSRAGPFREGVDTNEGEGRVFDWDPEKKELVNPEKTTSFYKRLSEQLYGVN